MRSVLQEGWTWEAKSQVGWTRAEVERMNESNFLQGLADPGDGVMYLVLSFARWEWCRLLKKVRQGQEARRSSLAGRIIHPSCNCIQPASQFCSAHAKSKREIRLRPTTPHRLALAVHFIYACSKCLFSEEFLSSVGNLPRQVPSSSMPREAL